ncbi:MAG: DUF4357 domain-containing protein [Victivallaceae bacterium]
MRSILKDGFGSLRQWYSPLAGEGYTSVKQDNIYHKQDGKTMKINPNYIINDKGEKIAVQLTIEEFEFLQSRDSKNNVSSKSEELPSALELKQPPGKPVPFEMHEEFCSANGMLLPDGNSFNVLTGSKASGIVDKSLEQHLKVVRKELIMLQVMVKDEESGDYLFARDYEFPNPTYAASIIAGSSRDGNISWICPDNGQILGAY